VIAKPLKWNPSDDPRTSDVEYTDPCGKAYAFGGHECVLWFGRTKLGKYANTDECKAAAQRHADECVANMLSDDMLKLCTTSGFVRFSDREIARGILAARNTEPNTESTK
jgi:hypothetical protein